jgi:hypothetical protein
MSLEQLEGLVTVVGVEHRAAEGLHDAHRGGAGLGHVLDHENGNLAHRHGSKLLNATAGL